MTFQSRVIAVLLKKYTGRLDCCANFGEDRRRQWAWRNFLKKLPMFDTPARPLNIRFRSRDFSQVLLSSKWLDNF